MKRWLVLLAILLPMAAATTHLAAPADVRLEEDNQVIRITWSSVDGATGYYLYVYSEGELVQPDETKDHTMDVDATSTTYRGTNARSYVVMVAAHGADGVAGARSDPVTGTPNLAGDERYLAIGLIVVWAGLWGYVLLFTRLDRAQRRRAGRIQESKRRSRKP